LREKVAAQRTHEGSLRTVRATPHPSPDGDTFSRKGRRKRSEGPVRKRRAFFLGVLVTLRRPWEGPLVSDRAGGRTSRHT